MPEDQEEDLETEEDSEDDLEERSDGGVGHNKDNVGEGRAISLLHDDKREMISRVGEERRGTK